ncbi:1,5-anhydro-D-fructose reductase-like [Sitophilus oryzae]|uniref:1,5-anhydro-D-fructose reductase-like n=1 Tax=Sitophilus oryzae TaxID=7048 RepID=A0A6J2YBB2_SITOR|nr:1,5-anhydro-D-fructose reductase-like [Sitophilus oryzae]
MAVPKFGKCNIPAVGYGTFSIVDEEVLEKALGAAIETGYRHIDTAHTYDNEHLIGKVLKKWFDSGKLRREDIFITTKLPPHGVHPDRVEKFLKESLEKLQLDYIDLYLIHFPVTTKTRLHVLPLEVEPTDHLAVWKKLEEQVDLGRVKNIGLSNFNQRQVARILEHSRIKPAANQVELHVYLQQPELVKFCLDNGVALVSYFSLGNPGIAKFFAAHGSGHLKFKQFGLLDNPTVQQIAEKHRKSTAQVLLRFLVQKNISVIPKSINPDRIKQNIDLFGFNLDEDDVKALESLDKGEGVRDLGEVYSQAVRDHPEYPF